MVKEFWKSVSISQSYRQKWSGTFFSGHGVYVQCVCMCLCLCVHCCRAWRVLVAPNIALLCLQITLDQFLG